LLYATILHALAGVVAGSIFRIPTLTTLLIVVLGEAVALTVLGVPEVLPWAASNLMTIQLGYFAGIFARRTVEQFGYSVPPARMRRPQ
jgi:hypothetical protein